MPESSAPDSTPAARPAKAAKAPRPKAASAGLPPWLTLLALGIGVVAVVLGVLGLFRPSTAASYSEQQAQDAKARICAVQATVRQGTDINTNLVNPVPGDAIGGLAVAANARLALVGGGALLTQRLAAEPATPADLATAVSAMADTMSELGVNYLAGAAADGPVQQPLREALRSEVAELDQLCQE